MPVGCMGGCSLTKKYSRLWLSRVSITQSSGNKTTSPAGLVQPHGHGLLNFQTIFL